MKISFDDGGYVEFSKSRTAGKLFISVGAKSANNDHETVVNSAELTVEQYNSLLSRLADEVDGAEKKPIKKKATRKRATKKKTTKKAPKKPVEGDEKIAS